jgi:hypothetical protein
MTRAGLALVTLRTQPRHGGGDEGCDTTKMVLAPSSVNRATPVFQQPLIALVDASPDKLDKATSRKGAGEVR